MGITVHFEGPLKSAAACASVVTSATAFTDANSWPVQTIALKSTQLKRVRDEEDWDCQGPTNGIELQPHPSSERVRLEFDENLYLQDYCKTQFAPVEVHKALIALLDLPAPHFSTLEVFDEGEYFETRDEQVLLDRLDECFQMMDDIFREDKSVRGPVRLPSGRIADAVGDGA